MKQIAYIIAFILVALTAIGARAEEINEISLTVSSDGSTKDDAVKNALRLAIEQAYGAFVSANTTILNDELVKDEIVTITHGAIKEFKEVAGAQLPDNRYSVTVQATVSLPNLITYAKNHGSECEFAGSTFGMQMKLYELQKQNELKALENLRETLKPMMASAMHWEIEVGEPKVDTEEGRLIDKSTVTIFSRDLNGKFSVQEDEYLYKLYKANPSLFDYDNGKLMKLKREDYYLVPISIYASVDNGTFDSEGNPNEPLYNYIKNTLASVSMTKDECEWAEAKGLSIISHTWGKDYYFCNHFHNRSDYFRNKEAKDIIYDIYNIISLNALNFAIEDNLGNRHRCYFYIDGPTCRKGYNDCKFGYYLGEILPVDFTFPTIFGFGTWKSPRLIYDEQSIFFVPIHDYKYGNIIDACPDAIPGLTEHRCKERFILSSPHVLQREVAHFYMRIPKNEISKYSSFRVVRDLDMSELYGK